MTKVAASHVGHIDWREADRALREIAARRAALDADEARWLLIARDARVHEAFGYGSFAEYCERALGYSPHTTRERVRVAEAITELPAITDALAAGAIAYSVVRELTRVATADTERAWLDAATGKTLREIEAIVSGHARGDLPSDPPDPDLEPRVLRLELSPEVYAMFLEARRAIQDETDERLDDSAIVAAMCERACRASTANDRAPYQVALTICARCNRATQDAAGQVLDVAPAVVERARCDADYVGALDAAEPARLTTDIPPSVRRLVHRRDHDRCTAPGCRHARFLDIHHIVPREHGGDHAMSNLTLLCDAHHRAVHEGGLRITGTAPDQLRFEHPDDVVTDAKRALRDLGFAPAIATAAVTRAASHVGRGVPLEQFLRACLRECPRPVAHGT